MFRRDGSEGSSYPCGTTLLETKCDFLSFVAPEIFTEADEKIPGTYKQNLGVEPII